MRICHVCSAHSADDGRVFHRACVSLAQAGYDVHLFARGKGSEPYSQDGVTVHPLPQWRSRFERMTSRSRIASRAAALEPDLFHVHEPELLGPVIARAGSRPVIWDVHESYLDVLAERAWIPAAFRPAARLAWDRRERGLVARCAGVVVVTERIAARYRRFHSRVSVVANYPDLSSFSRLSPPVRDGRTCAIVGGIVPDKGISEAVAALGILKRRGISVPLTLAGPADPADFPTRLLQEAKRLNLDGLVTYGGVLSKADAIALQNQASIGLVLYLPRGNNMAGLPNKLLECMALGLPLVYSNFDGYREVAGGSGIPVDPTQPDKIADAIEHLVKDPEAARAMGENGRRAVQERFNWSIERGKLLDIYQDILGKPAPSANRTREAL